MKYLGDFAEDATVHILFTTSDSSGGAVAPSDGFENTDIAIYKDNGAAQKTTANGVTMTSPFDTVTGLHAVTIDTSNDTGDAGFWVTGSNYIVVLNPDTETVDSQTVVAVIGSFSIENRWNEADVTHVKGTLVNVGTASGSIAADVRQWIGSAPLALSSQRVQASLTTALESDIVAIESELIVVHSDTTAIHSDTTIIASDVVIIGSDVVVLDAAVSDVESSLVIVKSDLVITTSDTAAIHSDTTIIASDVVIIGSDIVVLDNAVSDVESSLVIVKSDIVILVSDTTAIHSDTTIIASDVVIVVSDTTAIHSQTTVIESDSITIQSSLVVVESQTTVIESDVALLFSAQAEPTGVPAANETIVDKLAYLFMVMRNRRTATSSKLTIFGDDNVAEFEHDLTDDGVTADVSEANAI